MRLQNGLLFIVSVFFLSGCYTQLQYSQRVHRITDRPSPPRSYYEDDVKKYDDYEDNTEEAYEEGYEEGYIHGIEDLYYYKDYEVANWYAHHGFSGYYRHHLGHHDPFYYSGYYYPYWRHHHHPRFFVSFGFGFHYGHFYESYYHYPYYYSFYYPRPIQIFHFNTFHFSGFAHHVGVTRQDNREFGRRSSIGTNRVRSTNVRDDTRRTRTVRGQSTQSVRSRARTVRSRSDDHTVRSSKSDNTRRKVRVRSSGRSGSDSKIERNAVTRGRYDRNDSDDRRRVRTRSRDRNSYIIHEKRTKNTDYIRSRRIERPSSDRSRKSFWKRLGNSGAFDFLKSNPRVIKGSDTRPGGSRSVIKRSTKSGTKVRQSSRSSGKKRSSSSGNKKRSSSKRDRND